MSLTALIVISFILYVLTIIVRGIGIYAIFPLIATIMFSMRKVGVFISFNNIMLVEIIPLVLSTVFKLLFKQFSWLELILTLVLRAIFIGIVVYDSKAYVYHTEEREVKK